MATTSRFLARHGLNNNNNTITGVSSGNHTIDLGGNLTTANSFTTSGNFALTLATTAATNVTLPTSGTLFVLPSLTSGSVLFSNGTTIAQDNANLFWDDTNNRLGIGTNAPTVPLDVNGQSRFQSNVGMFTAPTSTVGLNLIRSVTATSDNVLSRITQTGTGNVIAVAAKFDAVVGSGGSPTNSTIGVYSEARSVSGSTVGSNGPIAGLFSASLASGTTVSSATAIGLAADVGANVNLNSGTSLRLRTFTSSTSTTTTMRGISLAHFQTTSGSTMTTYRGLTFEGWIVNAGATVTTNSLIYADTTVNVGTTKHCLYFLPDMPSYHVGKFGIGTGVTAPVARLEVRDTSEQLRLSYDADTEARFLVDSAGKLTISSYATATSSWGSIAIGGSTSNSIGFFGATPVAQQTSTVATPPTMVTNTGTAVNDASTWDGYTIGEIVKCLRNYGLLA